MAMHGKPAAVEGALVLFPKSPQVIFNVFAVLQELPGGMQRQYTLVNFESTEAFDDDPQETAGRLGRGRPVAESGRNKLDQHEGARARHRHVQRDRPEPGERADRARRRRTRSQYVGQ